MLSRAARGSPSMADAAAVSGFRPGRRARSRRAGSPRSRSSPSPPTVSAGPSLEDVVAYRADAETGESPSRRVPEPPSLPGGAADAATDPASAPPVSLAADGSPAAAVLAALSTEPAGATVAVIAARDGRPAGSDCTRDGRNRHPHHGRSARLLRHLDAGCLGCLRRRGAVRRRRAGLRQAGRRRGRVEPARPDSAGRTVQASRRRPGPGRGRTWWSPPRRPGPARPSAGRRRGRQGPRRREPGQLRCRADSHRQAAQLPARPRRPGTRPHAAGDPGTSAEVTPSTG
jgi:hypothetical protein